MFLSLSIVVCCTLGDSMPCGGSGAPGKAACQAEPSHPALDGSLEKGSPKAFPESSRSSPCSAHAALPQQATLPQ